MKRVLSVLLTVGLFAAALIVFAISRRTVQPVYAQGGCNLATLTGNFGFTFSGLETHSSGGHGSPNIPFRGAGLGTFDGVGNFSATFASSFNGSSSTGNLYSGTYTVNSDCTGLLTATPGSGGDNFAFVIVSAGTEILATDLTPGDTLSLDFKKQ